MDKTNNKENTSVCQASVTSAYPSSQVVVIIGILLPVYPAQDSLYSIYQ